MSSKAELPRYWREIQVKFSRFYARILLQVGLTLPQYALLSQLTQAGRLPMTEISEKLHISKPAVTHLVDRLEKKKCLKRVPHPKDRRIYLLKLEPKGERMVRRIQSEVLDLILKTLKPFKAHERKTIERFYLLLSKIVGDALASPEEI